jgi:hypothetical protein
VRGVSLVCCLLLVGTTLIVSLPRGAEAQPAVTQTFTQPEATSSLPSGSLRFAQSNKTAEESPTAKQTPRTNERAQRRDEHATHWLGDPKNVAAVFTCVLIIGGGLWTFNWLKSRAEWDSLAVQTLGTIFFFPTLILLCVYIDLSTDAVTTILGAFVGYLFNQGNQRRTNRDGPTGQSAAAEPVQPPEGPTPRARAR